MLQERIAALTTFVEEKYIPYFNYYWSFGLIIARSVILAILVVTTLVQIGITLHSFIGRKKSKQRKTITMLMIAGLTLVGALIFWGLAVSWHTQIIALLMTAIYLWLIVYQKKHAKADDASCKPGAKCCLCPCRKCLWILMIVGYLFVLFTGWLFFVE